MALLKLHAITGYSLQSCRALEIEEQHEAPCSTLPDGL